MASNNSNNVGNTHDGVSDQVTIHIDEKLRRLPTPPPENSIFKVPNELHELNEKAYKPLYIAIGPYHRNNDNRRRDIEEQKEHYLNRMLRRGMQTTVDRHVQALKNIEDEVRQQYAGIVNLTREEFLEMMLLDGCFIIELFRKCTMWPVGDENDRLLSVDWFFSGLQRDLLLLENQLPFVVLETLYGLANDDVNSNQHDLISIAWNFFAGGGALSLEVCRCKHLLDLVYQGLNPGLPPAPPALDMKWGVALHFSATKLKEFGIKFEGPRHPNNRIFDIKFKKGTLCIPQIDIHDHTEAFFLNLIAYEYHCPELEIKYVTTYVSFLVSLVNTPEDVELLCREGVIYNFLRDPEAVLDMLMKIGGHVPYSMNTYALIVDEVNKHCYNVVNRQRARCSRWMASLLRDHCYSPWVIISILAAAAIFVLTLIQTLNSF